MRRVMDSNVVIDLWRGRHPSPARVRTQADARRAASAWLALHPGDGLITTVRLELLAGGRDKAEVELTEYFLDQLPILDNRVLPEDWTLARRLAKRTPFGDEPRDAVDCLIRAVCKRLRAVLATSDTGVPPA